MWREVAGEIQFKLSPEDRARAARKHPVSAGALEEYLKGRYFWNRHTPEGDRKAIEHFQRAIDLEPAYAMAYDGLADAWICCSYDISAQRQVIDKARAAAWHALELEPNLGEPHVTLGLIAWNHDLDWPGAEREFRLAIGLNTNYPTAHHWYGEFLSHMGRFEEAAAEMGRARELDPLSPIITTDTGTVYYYARDYDRTIEWCRRALDLEPNFIRARSWLTVAYYMKGMYREALEENRRVRASDENWFTIAVTGVIYAGMGKPAAAHAILRELERRARLQYVSPFSFAFVYTALDEKDRAFAWLEQAYRERAVGLNSMKTNPFFDPLRLDPRYPALLDRLRLGEEN